MTLIEKLQALKTHLPRPLELMPTGARKARDFAIDECIKEVEDYKLLDPDMPTQELRLHMGELIPCCVLTARAALRWANSLIWTDDDYELAKSRRHEKGGKNIDELIANSGEGESCYWCKKPINSLVGDPGKWGILLCHKEEPGVPKWHHRRCVEQRMVENQPMKQAGDDA